MEELAPELVPMLQSIEMPANFVPVTNAVLAEMARRGIGRQQILTALRNMGSELPEESVQMIQVGSLSAPAQQLLLQSFPIDSLVILRDNTAVYWWNFSSC